MGAGPFVLLDVTQSDVTADIEQCLGPNGGE